MEHPCSQAAINRFAAQNLFITKMRGNLCNLFITARGIAWLHERCGIQLENLDFEIYLTKLSITNYTVVKRRVLRAKQFARLHHLQQASVQLMSRAIDLPAIIAFHALQSSRNPPYLHFITCSFFMRYLKRFLSLFSFYDARCSWRWK